MAPPISFQPGEVASLATQHDYYRRPGTGGTRSTAAQTGSIPRAYTRPTSDRSLSLGRIPARLTWRTTWSTSAARGRAAACSELGLTARSDRGRNRNGLATAVWVAGALLPESMASLELRRSVRHPLRVRIFAQQIPATAIRWRARPGGPREPLGSGAPGVELNPVRSATRR